MPNFKSISFKMAVLQGGGGGQNQPSPCVCYPKDPMWNRVNVRIHFQEPERKHKHGTHCVGRRRKYEDLSLPEIRKENFNPLR